MEKKESEKEYIELDFETGKIRIQKHIIDNAVVFRIVFSDKRAPLVVTRALRQNATKFWTSIPEGRQPEAEKVGAAIFAYYKKVD